MGGKSQQEKEHAKEIGWALMRVEGSALLMAAGWVIAMDRARESSSDLARVLVSDSVAVATKVRPRVQERILQMEQALDQKTGQVKVPGLVPTPVFR